MGIIVKTSILGESVRGHASLIDEYLGRVCNESRSRAPYIIEGIDTAGHSDASRTDSTRSLVGVSL
jgi:hypothetical protein